MIASGCATCDEGMLTLCASAFASDVMAVVSSSVDGQLLLGEIEDQG